MASGLNQPRQQNVSQSRFAMVPRSDVPRSLFKTRSAHKTTFDAGKLIPVYLNEVLPGDSFRLNMTAFTRMQPAIFPIMDNLYMDSFWFFVPCRLLWTNWNKFMGERHPLPDSSTDYLIPIIQDGYVGTEPGSLPDYMGLPTQYQITGAVANLNALPFRAYKLIWDEWFRDQNLQDALMQSSADFDDGPDFGPTSFVVLDRGKRHDYFTSALPWPQKGDATAVPLPGTAPVSGFGIVAGLRNAPSGTTPNNFYDTASLPGTTAYPAYSYTSAANAMAYRQQPTGGGAPYVPDVYADLSQATGVLINDLRMANSMQRLLERDARGGTRYTEILRSHFGVISPDARLQRPEYLGGSSSPIHINPVAQTSETGTTPLGNLAGVGTGVHQSGFSQSFTEHGYLFCIVNVRADLTYQQGFHRLWSRSTKFDFYWPAFAHLGEQAVLRKEIYALGTAADDEVFGYQERWSEYRYFPSKISGMFRSGIPGTLDAWHLAQEFATPPTLSDTFIVDAPPMERVLAGGEATLHQQFLFDSVFEANMVRPMPTYSVPGLGDRF